MTLFIFFLLSLATARIVWLITEDHLPLVERPRRFIVDRKPDGNLAYLVGCWWCTSVYIAAGAAAFAVWVLGTDMILWPGDTGAATIDSLSDWKFFLLLWPALSMSSVAIMGALDWLTSAPDHD